MTWALRNVYICVCPPLLGVIGSWCSVLQTVTAKPKPGIKMTEATHSLGDPFTLPGFDARSLLLKHGREGMFTSNQLPKSIRRHLV